MNPTISFLNSPIGWLEIHAQNESIESILFKEKDFYPSKDQLEQSDSITIVEVCKSELTAYFEGKKVEFSALLSPKGTDFQKKVWQALVKIPFGETISYEKLSIQLGDIKAIRAVAAANGQNPLMILCPCHRVIGKNGQLTGYAGGLWRKQWLLEHEAKVSGKKKTLFD